MATCRVNEYSVLPEAVIHIIYKHVIVVRWRRVVYVACASGVGSIDHEGGARVGL